MVARDTRGGTSWTTQDELAFLEGLGTHNIGSEKKPRRTWLEEYATALSLRSEWQSIDYEMITQATRAYLERVER